MCNYKTEFVSNFFEVENYKCNRAIYKNNYCIFHFGLKDNNSNEINEDEVKQKESDFNYALQVYLNDKNLKEYDFIGWLFPKLNFNNFKLSDQDNFVFNLPVKFIKTIFADEADFIKVIFAKDAYFEEAKFEGVAYFNKTKFLEGSYFNKVNFKSFADFEKVNFKSLVYFIEVKFEGPAGFYYARFADVAKFNKIIFADEVYFEESKFEGYADFVESKFEGGAYFNEVNFAKEVIFIKVSFVNLKYLCDAKFKGKAFFKEAIFAEEVNFNNSIFEKEVHFNKIIFLNKFVLDFVNCKEYIYINNCFLHSLIIEKFNYDSIFIISNSCIENIVIQNSIFQKINFNNVLSNSINDDLKKLFKKNEIEIKNESTENIEWNFSGQDLSNFSFIECDFSVANFLSANIQKTHIDNCIFPTDKVGRKKLFNHNTNADDIKLQFTYQRFKRQFTENHYYQLAQDFHFQEMELRKKLSKSIFEKIVLKIYNFLSCYGTNYLRPFIYLLIWVFIYPIILLYKTWEINLFCNTWDYDLYGQTFSALFKLLAPFKLIHGNDDDFLNIYNIYINTGFGIFLVVFFYIVVTILITMFLQALSRNFKR